MLQKSKSTFKGGTLREYLGGTGPSTDLKPKRENLEMKLQEKKCSCSSFQIVAIPACSQNENYI